MLPLPWQRGHLSRAAARRAGLRLAPGARAAALAGLACRHPRNADLGLEAVRRLLERDLQVVAQVGAAEHRRAAAAPACAAAEDLAEDVAEDVAEAAHAGARRGLRIDPRMAELIVGGALAGVGQDLVGFLRLLEVLLGLRVVRIAVRMPFHRQAAIGLLQVFF
jgi:hypothetical protein